MKEFGKLYLISIPIGNYDDITLRGIKVLKGVDTIICEEYKEAKRFLSHLEITKPLISMNEHNEESISMDILYELINGKSFGMISDCGTPLFSDPGLVLVRLCIENRVDIIPVPGANSILPALITSGFSLDDFYYAGWLSPKTDIRKKELLALKHLRYLLVIMDTPYRLIKLLEDVRAVFGKGIEISLAYQISLQGEKFYRGTIESVISSAKEKSLKGEFVLVVNNRKE